MDFLVFLALLTALALVTTYLIKRYTKHPTFYVVTVLRTTRLNAFFDTLKDRKMLEYLTIIGSILGFGAFGFDFFIGNKIQNKFLRVGAFLAVTAVLGYLFGFLFNGFITDNPLLPITDPLIVQLAFGLGGFSFAISLFLLFSALHIIGTTIAGGKTCPGIAPVLPGVDIPNVDFTPPVEAWISLFLILVVHEASHGFLSRRHNVTVKHSGVLTFGPFPIGAFVEPDEEQIKQLSAQKAVQIFAAGPTSNFVSMILVLIAALLVGTFVTGPLVAPFENHVIETRFSGVTISHVDQNVVFCRTAYPSSAFDAGIESGTKILKINGDTIHGVTELRQHIAAYPHQSLRFTLEKDGRIFDQNLSPNALGQFGVRLQATPNPDYVEPPQNQQLLYSGYALGASILAWFILLSFFVAISNFLPIVPFDGGRMAELIFAPYFGFMGMNDPDTRTLVKRLFLWILVPILLANVAPLFF
ncbi:MAG: site-2 protease family protein [Candidatus Diapherotrites archaeon]|nr:site-2 protease family protein [Candidatus Diapherotrites archaeon]